MNFTISDPFTKLWKDVEDIEQFSTAAASPYSQTQLINIALHVIKSITDSQRGLSDWYALPTAGQMWLNLKIHSQTARQNRKKVRGSSIHDAKLHQANQNIEEIQYVKQSLQTMQEAQRSVFAAIEDNQTTMSQVASHLRQTYTDGRIGFVSPNYVQEEHVPPSEPSANSTITSQTS